MRHMTKLGAQARNGGASAAAAAAEADRAAAPQQAALPIDGVPTPKE
jgi:hypothetical protein